MRFIIVYGRPFSPMSPWGLDGGGPLNDQQIDTLIAYIESIQIEREDCGEGEDDPRLCDSGHLPGRGPGRHRRAGAPRAVEDGEYASYGEALFNLDLASGAYCCARCHTPGWSWGDRACRGRARSAGTSPTVPSTPTSRTSDDMIDFVKTGSELGAEVRHPGPGQRAHAGFGRMLTDEQIEAIVDYVRSL